MTSRWYIVPAIGGTAFVLTLLLLMGRQGRDAALAQSALALVHSNRLSERNDLPRTAASAALSAPRGPPVASGPQEVDSTSAVNEASGAAQNPSEELAPPPPNESQKLVPVLFKFDANPAGAQVGATVRNMSGKPLDLKVAATDPASGSQSVVQVVVPAHATEDLAAQGLIVSSASVLTVQSPPYLERSITVQ